MASPSVAILHYSCPPVVGGVEQLIATHARLFVEHGYSTRVITGKGERFRDDVPVQVVPSLFSKDRELLAVNEALDLGLVDDRFHSMVERLRAECERALKGVNLCIVHNAFTLHFNLPLTAALWRMVESGTAPRLVAWCHDLSWTNPLYIEKMRDSYPWSLLKEPVETAQYVAVSELRRRELVELMGLPAGRFTVVPAGVDPVAQLKLEPATVELVSRLGLLEGELLMLAPVRITKRKKLEMSIRITHALRELGVDARLVVTGPPGPHNIRSGDYVAELMELRRELGLERQVIFLFEQMGKTASPGEPRALAGEDESYPISNRMMYDLYSLSDLLLFSSSQEGFGIPLIEAGMFRLPVFCSDIPPFREIGEETVNYFQLDDAPKAVAQRIRGWMSCDTAHKLRRRVLSRYWWESIFREKMKPLVEGR